MTLLEEVVLLTLNPQTGRLGGGDALIERYALAGAILFDLSLARRIDTDEETLTVVDQTPTGHPIQDRALAELVREGGSMTLRSAIQKGFYRGSELDGEVKEVVRQLADKGIIRQEVVKRLWVIDVKRFRLVEGDTRQMVTARLAQAILQDEIPEVPDIMLVSLAHACGLLGMVLSETQIEMRSEWIATLVKVESISRGVSKAIRSLRIDRRQL